MNITKLIHLILNRATSAESKEIQETGNAILDDLDAKQKAFDANRERIEENHKKTEEKLKNGARLTKHRISL